MDTYMVTLTDRHTHLEQRILVSAPGDDTEEDVREFVLRPGLTGTNGEIISLADPVVTGIRKLHIKRPVRNVTFTQVSKAVI